MRSVPALVMTLLLLALAPAALAGTPFTIGTGKTPNLAVDPGSGALHAVFTDEPEAQVVHYCRVPRGATACDLTRDLPALPGPSTADDPFILREPGGRLDVVMSRYVGGDTYLWTSVDDGATWSAPVKIYDASPGTNFTEPVLGPQAGEVTVATWNSGRRVFAAKLDGSEGGAGAVTDLPDANPVVPFLLYNLSVAPTADGGLIAAADTDTRGDSGPVGLWRMAPGGDPSLNSFGSQATMLGAGYESRLAGSAAAGTHLVTLGQDKVLLRTWQSGTSFGAPVAVATPGSPYVPDAAVGGATTGAVWRINGSPNYDVWLTRSTDGGGTFAAPQRIADDPAQIFELRLGLAGDGAGWVVWTSANKVLKAASTEPLPQPTPAPGPGPGSTPAPSGPKTKKVTATVPGATITFGVPGQCVQPGSTFKVTLAWKRKKRKGNKFVKVTRADFYIGTKVVRKDRKAPFVQTLRVTASARRGSTINLRARAFIKVKKGKGPKKSIKAQIKVCA